MTNIPNFPINPADLLLVGDLLKPYAEVLQKTMPPSQAQRLLLQRITDLRRRISAIGSVREGQAIPFVLIATDIAIILDALELFLKLLPHVDMQDDLKKETIQSASRLYLALKTTFQKPQR